MKLTPLDIRHQEFKRGMRGYNDVEVDEFLDAVADEYERIFKENIDLSERLEALQEKIAGYKRIEDTLQKTLVSAQASAEELKQNATKQSQLILGDAELKARQLVNDAYTEKQTIEQSMAKLRSAEQDFRFKFRQLLEGYLQQLSVERPMANGEEPVPPTAAEEDFMRHAEAIKEAIAREAATAAEVLAQVHGGDETAAEATGAIDAGDEALEDAEDETPAERATIGEGDDLMADVDSGVNENEFKW